VAALSSSNVSLSPFSEENHSGEESTLFLETVVSTFSLAPFQNLLAEKQRLV